jgi:hypothetical protein
MAPVTYEALGARLRMAREDAHRTQRWVAAQLQTGQGLISLYERGATRPTPKRLAAYAVVLGLDLDELQELARYAPSPSSFVGPGGGGTTVAAPDTTERPAPTGWSPGARGDGDAPDDRGEGWAPAGRPSSVKHMNIVH